MRYETKAIVDADMTTLGAVLYAGDDYAEAREWASGAPYEFGAAIVDHVAGTVEWGHATTAIGEPAPPVDCDE